RRRHTRWPRDWSSDVCSSDLTASLIHFDVGIPLGVTTIPGEPFTGAAIPEAVIAGVLLGGALALLARPPGGWGLALTTTLFALRSEERRVGNEGRSLGWRWQC